MFDDSAVSIPTNDFLRPFYNSFILLLMYKYNIEDRGSFALTVVLTRSVYYHCTIRSGDSLAPKQCFPVVLSIMLYRVIVRFESRDEILNCV